MATMEQVRDAMHATPFRPFTVYLADGRAFFVKHPDFVSISPNGWNMVVNDEDGPHLIDVRAVVELYPSRSPESAAERPAE